MISQLLLTVSRYRVSRYRQTLAINKRRRLHLSPTSTGRAFFVVGVLLTLGLLSLYGWRTVVASATELSAIDAVTAAWTKASDSGSYRFSSELKQTTNPTAKVSNAGRSGKTENLYFEGQTDLRNQKMELNLWAQSGSAADPESGMHVKVENGKTFARQGTEPWQEIDDFTNQFAPQGDFLAYLNAIQDVTAHEPEVRHGIAFTRYSFRINGPTLALYMRDQMEATLRAKGELPPGGNLEVPTVYRDMTGDGEVWINEAGYPIRQMLNLTFPEQRGEIVESKIVINFSDFAQPPLHTLTLLQRGDFGTAMQNLASNLPNAAPFFVLLSMLGVASLIILYRSNLKLQTVTTLSVIVSMLVGPMLSTMVTVGILDRRTAKAAQQEEQRTEQKAVREYAAQQAESGFDARENPLVRIERETVDRGAVDSGTVDNETEGQSGDSAILQSPNLQSPNLLAPAAVIDDGTDTDKDGLTDFVEVRLSTDPKYSDSDEDGVTDKEEVNGVGGWFGNPTDMDSNRDGLADGLEWDVDSNGQLDDTDGDKLPNAFDPDNDNDGVPDRIDSAPFSSASRGTNLGFDNSNPFQFTINDLEAGKPTFVDFQIRPLDKNQLWYAFNVLDWPQDSEGQVRDIDNKTYTSVGANGANDDFGDMKLVPMLEIRMPTASANLPSKADLTTYNINVSPLRNNSSVQVAYVPLNVITTQETGERVAFSARMRYLPTGTWSGAHEARLVWLIQTLTDVPCDPADAEDVKAGCTEDGYIHNVAQVVQSYYEPFTITGLNIREDHGEKTAIIYEDPATDTDKKDDRNLVALAHGLENSFLGARDQDGNKVRDVTIDDIKSRFDRNSNSGTTETQRWAIPANALKVEVAQYKASDESIMTTAMTETKRVLNSAFASSWQADKNIKPMLMYAREETYRSLGLDALRISGGYVTQNGTSYTFDLLPTGQTKVTKDINASLKWTPYCAPSAASPIWQPCAVDDYWTELETRHGFASGLPGDPNDPDIYLGRLTILQLYITSLMQGVSRIVQNDGALVSPLYTRKSDTVIESTLRSALVGGAAGVKAVTNIVVMAYFVDKIGILKWVGRQIAQFRAGAVGQTLKSIAFLSVNVVSVLKNGVGTFRLLGTAVVLGAAGILAGIATGLYFFVDSFMSENAQKSNGGKIALRTVILAITFYLSVAGPILAAKEWADALKLAGSSFKIWSTSARVIECSFRASIVGTVLSVAVTWGLFAYSMVSNNVGIHNAAFKQGLLESVATTLLLLLLLMISYTVLGTIIVGVLAFVDLLLTAICELGVNNLRTVPGLNGACFTLTTSAVKTIVGLVYNNEVLIDLTRNDLMVTGAPKFTFANPDGGIVDGQQFTVTMPITTTLKAKYPDDDALLSYPNFYSFDNMERNDFRYNLNSTGTPPPLPGTDVDVITPGHWQLAETTVYAGSSLTLQTVRARDNVSSPAQSFKAGINQKTNLALGMSFKALSADCWSFFGLFPKCTSERIVGSTTSALDAMVFDVFPATFSGFTQRSSRASGGVGLAWDARFPAIKDADGDGLLATTAGGLDPNDASWDSDGDGLSDRYEMDQRASGDAYSALQSDTDNDGLSDKFESQIGSNPAAADTDNDGLRDGEEVFYQTTNSSGQLVTQGGWQITINNAAAQKVWVSSDLLNADTDFDGVNDQTEKQLALSSNPAARIDPNGVPYNPRLANTPPVRLYVDSNAIDGYVAPNQAVVYSTTAIALVPVEAGVLQVTTAPSQATFAPQKMAFTPLTFNTAQTVTAASNFTVQPGTQTLDVTSTLRTRLQSSGSSDWVIDPVVKSTPITGFTAPFTPRNTSLFASSLDRPDRYWLGVMTSDGPFFSFVNSSNGEIRNYILNSGAQTVLEKSGNQGTSYWKRGYPPFNYATNNVGTTMVVWDHADQLSSNTSKSILGGVLVDKSGAVIRTLNFALPSNVGYQVAPVVASNGDGFLVAFTVYTDDPEKPTFNLVNVGVVMFGSDGVVRTMQIHRANTSDKTNQLNIDLIAIDNGNYRVAWKQDKSTNIWTGQLNANGALLSPWVALVNDASASNLSGSADKTPYTPKLAFDPKTGRWILVYSRGTTADGVINLYPSSSSTTPLTTRNLSGGGRRQNFAAYVPATGGWLTGAYTTTQTSYLALKSDLADLNTPATPLVMSGLADVVTGSTPGLPGASLACPAYTSNPILDLRFEELPGATSFADASLNATNATCTGNSCPAAGFSGAPNASASDYALQFDGVDDVISATTGILDSFTVAFWVKVPSGANPNGALFSHGNYLSRGWGVYLNNGAPTLVFNGSPEVLASKRVDDGEWHFVTATRDQVSGDLAIYVDGALGASKAFGRENVNAGNLLTFGTAVDIRRQAFKGQLDHVQLYRTRFTADSVKALYDRTIQSYCVVSAPGTNFANVQWGTLAIRRPDPRGGVVDASISLKLLVDNQAPTASFEGLLLDQWLLPNTIIGGNATDVGSGVAKVEVSLDAGTTWQPATGLEAWTFRLPDLPNDRRRRVEVRAVDAVGNVGASTVIQVRIDGAKPDTEQFIGLPETIKATKTASGQWQAQIGALVGDTGSGLDPSAVRMLLRQQENVGEAQQEQLATFSGSGALWLSNYLFDASLADPTGVYTFTVKARDLMGNEAENYIQVLRVDVSGPDAFLSASDAAREVISQTITIGGVVTDSKSIVGVDKVEIAFTPIEQVLALPNNIAADAAEAQLNRPWNVATLAQAGQPSTSWSYQLSNTLEGIYQIDLRATDKLGNVRITPNVWRGTIDTRAPRVTMTGAATGNSQLDAATNTQRYEIRYTCRAEDWQLNESSFDCPGNAIQPASRAFNNSQILQTNFPSLTLLIAMSNTWTIWSESNVPTGTTSACDVLGLCSSAAVVNGSVAASNARIAAAGTTAAGTTADAPSALPKANILNPTYDSFVGSTGNVEVTVGAEAAQGLREVTIFADGEIVATIPFARIDKVKVAQESLPLVLSAGKHELKAVAIDWAGNQQNDAAAIRFTVVSKEPTVALGKNSLTLSDTWSAQSGMVILRGTVDDDSDNLAAVQVKVGDEPYIDAKFADGSWGVAYPVIDPENRSLPISVRALDKAGNITRLGEEATADFATGTAPETTIVLAPPASSTETSAVFSFTGTFSGTAVTAFECSLDGSGFSVCSSPKRYSDLSNGSHSFRVHAINGRGTQDPTPAEAKWTVQGGGVEAKIGNAPAAETSSRSASFELSGGSAYECSLDGAAFTACSTPVIYSNLSDGTHTFQVRVKGNPASKYTWKVTNAAPLAASQVLTTAQNSSLLITLQANDESTLKFIIVGKPANGSLSGTGANLTYQPATDFFGSDSFSFKADDGDATSNLATVTINVTPTPGQSGVERGNFVVFGSEGVILRDNVKVLSGDIAASLASNGPWLGDGAEVSIGRNVSFADSKSKVLGDSLFVGEGTTLGDANFNDLVGPGTVNGTKVTPQALPLLNRFVSLPAIAVGKQNVDVAAGAKLTLAPGSYLSLNVAKGAEVTFSGGLYSFKEWHVADSSKLFFAGTSEVRISGQVQAGMNSYVGPAANSTVTARQITIFVAGVNANVGNLGGLGGKAATFGPYATLAANVVVPNGTLLIRERSKAVGSFVGRWVSVGKFSELTLANRFGSSPLDSRSVDFVSLTLDEATGLNATAPLSVDVDAELLTEEGSNEEVPEVGVPSKIYLPIISGGTMGQSENSAVENGTVDAAPIDNGAKANLLFLPVVTR